MDSIFKECPACSHYWESMVDLIRDGDLFVNGYQASFNDAHEGLFLLTHNISDCGSTLAIPAGRLKELYDGPEHMVHMAYTDRCQGHCLVEDDFAPCTNECDMKWARDVLQILKNHGPEEFLKRIVETRHTETA